MSFVQNGSGSSRISNEGDAIVESTVIDKIFTEQRVTCIKMDVEGYEMPALRGGMNTIQRDKPVLIICAYNKVTDIWEIPNYMKKLVPEYEIYLRNYLGNIEYVYYAVPKKELRIVANRILNMLIKRECKWRIYYE